MQVVAHVEIGEEVRVYGRDPEDYKGKYDIYDKGVVIATGYDTAIVRFCDSNVKRYRLEDLRRTVVYYERAILIPLAEGAPES